LSLYTLVEVIRSGPGIPLGIDGADVFHQGVAKHRMGGVFGEERVEGTGMGSPTILTLACGENDFPTAQLEEPRRIWTCPRFAHCDVYNCIQKPMLSIDFVMLMPILARRQWFSSTAGMVSCREPCPAKWTELGEAALHEAIDQFQRLAEDYRELERMLNAPLQSSFPPEVTLNSRIDAAEFAPKQASEMLGLRPQPINDHPFPERYQYLAVSAYERGDIGDSDLAHYFRCDIVTAREIVTRTLSSREVVEVTGEDRDVRLDFRKSLLSEVP